MKKLEHSKELRNRLRRHLAFRKHAARTQSLNVIICLDLPIVAACFGLDMTALLNYRFSSRFAITVRLLFVLMRGTGKGKYDRS